MATRPTRPTPGAARPSSAGNAPRRPKRTPPAEGSLPDTRPGRTAAIRERVVVPIPPPPK